MPRIDVTDAADLSALEEELRNSGRFDTNRQQMHSWVSRPTTANCGTYPRIV